VSTAPTGTSKPATAEPWTIGRVIRWAAEDFAKRSHHAPRLDAELLLGAALGLDRVRLIIESERTLTAHELARYRSLIERRRRGEPIAYILGRREFFGLDLVVDRRVLVPRPDTEALVEVALERTRGRSAYGRALDLCTGSGCVALAFAKARPTWRVTATDLDEDALALAWENTRRTGIAHALRVLPGDLFAPVRSERFDLVVGNPPYIPSSDIAGLMVDVRDFEPRRALDGGPDGLDLVRTIVREAPERLTPGGLLALEVGFDQGDRVAVLFQSAGFSAIERRRDYGGHERVVSGRLAT
jgi:release factor glutamine methyltransferase